MPKPKKNVFQTLRIIRDHQSSKTNFRCCRSRLGGSGVGSGPGALGRGPDDGGDRRGHQADAGAKLGAEEDDLLLLMCRGPGTCNFDFV